MGGDFDTPENLACYDGVPHLYEMLRNRCWIRASIMLVKLLLVVMHYIPWLKRRLWRRVYQRFAGYETADWSFMNYGYAPLDSEPARLELSSADEPNRYSIQLYHRVARAIPLAGKTVLEVGSGRGGGASFVARYHSPQRIVGVDFSEKAVQLCNERHKVEGLSFQHGDAESLPFEDASFDVVLNVESSHCYGSMPKFLSEVQRVLRPGGYFSFVDVRFSGHRMQLHSDMVESGLTIIEFEEITPQVFEALRLESDQKPGLVEQRVGKADRAFFARLWGVKGSDTYESFENGSLLYLRYVLKKPECATTPISSDQHRHISLAVPSTSAANAAS